MPESDILQKKRVPPERLRRLIDPHRFPFETTAEIEPLRGTIGQERALEAIQTGLEISSPGYNIFACGVVGTGRNSTIKALVEAKAATRPVPNDWCYVHNFENPDVPKALELPPGKGREFASDMDELIRDCRAEISKAFEGQDFEKRKDASLQQLQEERSRIITELQEKVEALDHVIRVTPAGIFTMPVVNGNPIGPEEFEKLDAETRAAFQEKGMRVQKLVNEALSKARRLEKRAKEEAENLERQVALFAVGHLIEHLQAKYAAHERIVEHLKQVQEDIIENLEIFKSEGETQAEFLGVKIPLKQAYDKYRVNVVVDHSRTEGAPVIEERNPTYYNLFGELEYRHHFGGMVTDFTMIKAGAVQRASGGYLILQALDVLRNPFAWEGLKRTLRTKKATIENMWEQYHPIPAATLRPEPIPVDVKVILVGSPWLHQLLYFLDEDFRRLFKIKADFDVEMDLTDEHLQKYAAFVSARCEEGDTPPFDRTAVAALAEYGARLAEHQERLSTRFLWISDLITEAGHVARRMGATCVSAQHVREAILARRRRSRMMQDKLQRMIEEGTLLIDTDSAVPGQVNGLAVYDLGDYKFGKPSRITCVTSVGRAGVVNIERESKMSGRIHDKGVLILSGYLASRFGQDKPLSLTASLCFEQSYSEVDGDSASCAELYALLSALSGLPLRQDIAVTGSVNQRGQVQPIGGVNHKIEGFFEICRKKGLTGTQGVLIPSRNLQGLMLDEEVVKAVEEGKFHIYAVDMVEEGIEILTGVPAGTRGPDGKYPEETVFGRADKRLREMADVLKEFGAEEEGEEKSED